MQFSTIAAVSALAAVASATYPVSNGTVVYTTEVFTAYTTYCPASTELTYAGITYTATEATTLTITNCPCTIVKPVTTSSVVAPSSSAPAPVYPTTAPVYANSTTAAATTKTAVGTGSATVSASSTPSSISSSGANRLALSGASLAGVLGLAAYFL